MTSQPKSSRSQLSIMPAVDFLVLLSVIFFALGSLSKVLSPAAEALDELEERTKGTTDMTIEDLEDRRSYITRSLIALLPTTDTPGSLADLLGLAEDWLLKLKDELADALRSLAAIQGAMADIRILASELEAKEDELKDLQADLEGRDRELEEAKRKEEKLRERLVAVEAARARAGADKYSFSSGAPLVNQGTNSKGNFDVLLAKGRVHVVDKTHFTITPRRGHVEARPSTPGLSIEDALRIDSALMQHVLAARFRETSRVRIILNSDSFPTYRALRDELVRRRVEYGWLAYEDSTLRFASSGMDADTVAHR